MNQVRAKLAVNFDPGQDCEDKAVSTSGNLNRTSVREKPRGVFYLPIG